MDHLLLLYTKLHSSRDAVDKLQERLKRILITEDSYQIDIYQHNDMQRRFNNYSTVTAIIVLDGRQQRIVLTPSTRDKSVDYWDELLEFSKGVTKPRGSVLVIVYGDENSKRLPEKEIISKYYENVWKYHDDFAYNIAAKRRCLSLWQQFNITQETLLKDYFEEIKFLPRNVNDAHILVLGNEQQTARFKEYMQLSKLLLHCKQTRTDDYTTDEYNTVYYPDKSKEKYSLTIYYENNSTPMNRDFCNDSCDFRSLFQRKTEKSWRTVFSKSDFDGLILFCHSNSHSCLHKIYLRNKGVFKILPMVTEEDMEDENIKNTIKGFLLKLMKMDQPTIDWSQCTLDGKTGPELHKYYIAYACSIPIHVTGRIQHCDTIAKSVAPAVAMEPMSSTSIFHSMRDCTSPSSSLKIPPSTTVRLFQTIHGTSSTRNARIQDRGQITQPVSEKGQTLKPSQKDKSVQTESLPETNPELKEFIKTTNKQLHEITIVNNKLENDIASILVKLQTLSDENTKLHTEMNSSVHLLQKIHEENVSRKSDMKTVLEHIKLKEANNVDQQCQDGQTGRQENET
ncbi:uncharacterized protein LOC144444209 [Glandiceps talaboti]